MESKYIFHLTEKLCVDIIIRRASEREFLVCEKADLGNHSQYHRR